MVGFDSDASISWDDFWGGANEGDVPYCSKEEYESLEKKVTALEKAYNKHTHSFSGSDTIDDTYRTSPSLSYNTSGAVTGWDSGYQTYHQETVSISGDTKGPSDKV